MRQMLQQTLPLCLLTKVVVAHWAISRVYHTARIHSGASVCHPHSWFGTSTHALGNTQPDHLDHHSAGPVYMQHFLISWHTESAHTCCVSTLLEVVRQVVKVCACRRIVCMCWTLLHTVLLGAWVQELMAPVQLMQVCHFVTSHRERGFGRMKQQSKCADRPDVPCPVYIIAR